MEDYYSDQRKESMFDNSKPFKEEIKTAQERKDEFDEMMTYNADLMKQKTDKAEQNKREQYEEKMEDKRMYEGVMNKIVKEDLESAMCKLEMKEKMRCEMVESQEQGKVLKQKQKSFDLKEEQHFRQEDLDTIDYDGIACAQRAEKFENKEINNENIYRAVQEKEAKTQRRDDLVKNLQEQQHVEQDIQDEVAQKEKVEQTNRDVQDVLIWQMQYKADVAAEECVRDAGFVHMSDQRNECMFDNSKPFKEEIKTAQERKDEFDDMMTYNADLMKQKTDKAEQNKREQYEEKMEDKRMYEGVMNKIVKEDLESAVCKSETKEKMRCEMVESQEQRKVLKQKQKSFDLKEEQHFRQEDLDTIDYDGIACAQRAEKFENKERNNEKIYRAVQEKEAVTQRRDDLVKNLQEQENQEQYIRDVKAQKEKVEQTNLDVQDVLIWQMQHKVDVAAEERVRDAGFVHMAQQQMFDYDEKERDNELKKKEEQEKYRQELRQQISGNEVRRKKNIEAEKQRQHKEDEKDRAYYNQ